MNSVIDPTTHFWTTRKQPTLSGSSPQEKGNTVKFVLNDQEYTVAIDENGYYEWTPPFELNDGEYSLSIYIVDQAQNVGIPKQVILHIDTTAPDKPEILRVIDDQGAQQGWLTPGARTDDTRPAFSGRAEAGSVVHLYDGGTLIGSAIADSTGGWEITPVQELPEGGHTFTVTSTDGRGHVSTASDAFTLTIGADAPRVVLITHAEDDAGTFQGTLTSGALTDDITPTLYGTAPAGSSVRIQYRTGDGQWADGGLATLNGTDWSWTPDPALSEGHWEFRANAGAGWTDEFKLDIDLTPGSELEITHAWDDFGDYTGKLDNGALTDDHTPSLRGRAEANSLVYVHYRSQSGSWALLGSAIAGPDGTWALEPPPLPAGMFEFLASDRADSSLVSGESFTLKIGAPAELFPQIHTIWDDVGNIIGNVKPGDKTNDTQPELRGKAEANSQVEIQYSQDGQTWLTGFATTDTKGNWSFTPAQPLESGDWQFKAKAGSGADFGNVYPITVAEYVTLTSYDFEDLAPQTFTSQYIYRGLTFEPLFQNNVAYSIVDHTIFGKSLLVKNGNISNPIEMLIKFNDKINYFELTAMDWEGANSYISFYDASDKEIGRVYARDIRNNTREVLRFFSKDIHISHAKIHLVSNLEEFFIDNILTKSDFRPTGVIEEHGYENLDTLTSGTSFSKGTQTRLPGGILFTTLDGTAATIHNVESYNAHNALFLRNNSLYELKFGKTEAVTFDYNNVFLDGGHNVRIYDTEGNILDIIRLSSADINCKKFSYTAPAGKFIDYIEIEVLDELAPENPTYNDAGFTIDNIAWGVNIHSGLESFDSYDAGKKFDLNRVTDLSGGLKISAVKLADSNADQTRIYNGNGKKRSLILGDNTIYKFDFGATEKVEFRLSAVHTADAHQFIAYSPEGEILYRGNIATVGSIANDIVPDLYQFIAPAGKKIGYIELVLGQETTATDSDIGFYIDDIKWGEYVHPVENAAGNAYIFDGYTEHSATEESAALIVKEVADLDQSPVAGREDMVDTLYIEGANQLLDLSLTGDKVKSVEIFDITGSGDNTLRIDAESLLAHGAKDVFIEDGKTQLMVNGNEGDVVQLADILPEGEALSGWTQEAGTVTVAGVAYNVYSNGEAELLVQEGVKTELV
ncbi:hypothetical protein D8B20_14575 [Candidatus Pantoea soli]|uniref:Bacterial Ig-like domain-containing protein n=2 Tax=Candidatus Pantoea soli TaxID=3098669 RepID=A0A518XG04_9GAMM|nr:hypothetical protein D8B20_14575 [Pantoea soli]